MIYCLFLIAVAVNVSRISMSVKATIVRMELSALMVSTNTSVDVDQDLRAHTAAIVRFMHWFLNLNNHHSALKE